MQISRRDFLLMFLICMYGQLGRGSGSCSPGLAPISELHDVTSISAGEFHAVAVNSQGAMYAWGYNKDGQLGNGSTSNRCATRFHRDGSCSCNTMWQPKALPCAHTQSRQFCGLRRGAHGCDNRSRCSCRQQQHTAAVYVGQVLPCASSLCCGN